LRHHVSNCRAASSAAARVPPWRPSAPDSGLRAIVEPTPGGRHAPRTPTTGNGRAKAYLCARRDELRALYLTPPSDGGHRVDSTAHRMHTTVESTPQRGARCRPLPLGGAHRDAGVDATLPTTRRPTDSDGAGGRDLPSGQAHRGPVHGIAGAWPRGNTANSRLVKGCFSRRGRPVFRSAHLDKGCASCAASNVHDIPHAHRGWASRRSPSWSPLP
jgi:hypothetical protein